MIRHVLLSTAFMLASTFTFANSANAEDAPASGPVAEMCVFGEPIEGDLIPNSTLTSLSSENGGRSAKVDISCNGNATLTVSKPIQTAIEDGTTVFNSSNLTATARSTILGLNVSSSSTIPGNIVANTGGVAIGTIEVDMVANNGSQKISPGKYTFTVTLTSTP
jgi:hypothetical protein